MAKKKTTAPKIKAEATAKAELVAKASYQRKRTTTEVIPPDVTRAKTATWLTIISPITEWAGLKGDVLKHRRQQLRIQQEAALDRLAKIVQSEMEGKEIVQPLPPKIMVPALEGASLENPDSPLLEWWANLLVSGATGGKTRPYYIDLMKVIGAEEAAFLSEIWEKFSTVKEYMYENFDVSRNTSHNLRAAINGQLEGLKGRQLDRQTYATEMRTIL